MLRNGAEISSCVKTRSERKSHKNAKQMFFFPSQLHTPRIQQKNRTWDKWEQWANTERTDVHPQTLAAATSQSLNQRWWHLRWARTQRRQPSGCGRRATSGYSRQLARLPLSKTVAVRSPCQLAQNLKNNKATRVQYTPLVVLVPWQDLWPSHVCSQESFQKITRWALVLPMLRVCGRWLSPDDCSLPAFFHLGKCQSPFFLMGTFLWESETGSASKLCSSVIRK